MCTDGFKQSPGQVHAWRDIQVAGGHKRPYCGQLDALVEVMPELKAEYFRRADSEAANGESLYGDFYLVMAAGEIPNNEIELVAGAASYELEGMGDTIRFVEDKVAHELHFIVEATALGITPSPLLPAVFKTMATMITRMLGLETVKLDVYAPGYLAYPEGVRDDEGDFLAVRRYKRDLLEHDFCDEGIWYFVPDRALQVLLLDEHACNGLDFLRGVYAKALQEVNDATINEVPGTLMTVA